ncbi:MAG: ester cyclase [Candidatus Geothermarchaeales archaeon]
MVSERTLHDEETGIGTPIGPVVTPDGQTIPATNKRVRFQNAHVFRLKDGKIVQTRVYYDQLGFLARLGLAPQG